MLINVYVKYLVCLTCVVILSFSPSAVRASSDEPLAQRAALEYQINKAKYDRYAQEIFLPEQDPVHSAPAFYVADTWKDKVKVSGQVRLSMGIDSHGEAVFNRANADLNERNYRILSGDQLNNYSDTYDPAIYSRIKVVVEAAVAESVAMHMNVTADPWSYTGKSKVVTVTTAWNDKIDVQYLSWGNTGYTLNQIVRTQGIGGAVALPELKLDGNKVPAVNLNTDIHNEYNQYDSVAIPETKMDFTFQPLRELWFDFKPSDVISIRAFPMAYQDQALTSDDPLKLSNNKTWWEESPWLRQWAGGMENTVASPVLFTQGYWDRSLAFVTRDSDGQRLTALRGMSFDYHTPDELSIQATAASPKTLWQDYGEYTAVPGSVRVKQMLGDKAYIGTTENMHYGFTDEKLDAKNFVESVDGAINPYEGIKFQAQVAASQSANDIQNKYYQTKKKGNAYYAAVQWVPGQDDVLKKDYFAMRLVQGQPSWFKSRLYFGRMDKSFEDTLSNYHETRKDAYWSRHLTFYPSLYRNLPGADPSTSEYDKLPYAIGDGLDYGRQVVGWRADMVLLDGLLQGMGDVRHVLTTEGKYVETVARTEWTHKTTDRLTTKALLLWQGMPDTDEGVDPFIVDSSTGERVPNSAVEAGKDPSLATGTVGARYDMTEWAAINGVWEHTNDRTLAADNFPQGVMNSAFFTTYEDGGRLYTREQLFVYGQDAFEQAPYPYFDIVKTGLLIHPDNRWNLYVDYTYNPNKFAGNIDDNMNHFGVESSYLFSPRFGLFGRYTFARWNDLHTLVNGHETKYTAYNNAFLETRYLPSQDQKLSLMYGVGPAYTVATSAANPILAYYSSPVLSTQHVVRMAYEKKF